MNKEIGLPENERFRGYFLDVLGFTDGKPVYHPRPGLSPLYFICWGKGKVQEHPDLNPKVQNDFKLYNLGFNPSSNRMFYFQGDSHTDLSLSGIKAVYTFGDHIVIEARNSRDLRKTLVIDRNNGLTYMGMTQPDGKQFKGLDLIRQCQNSSNDLYQARGVIDGEKTVCVPNLFRSIITSQSTEEIKIESLALGAHSNMKIVTSAEGIQELLAVTKSRQNPGVRISFVSPGPVQTKFRRLPELKWNGFSIVETSKDLVAIENERRRVSFQIDEDNFSFVESKPFDPNQDLIQIDLAKQTARYLPTAKCSEIIFENAVFHSNDSQALRYTGERGFIIHRIAVGNNGEIKVTWDNKKFLADFEADLNHELERLLISEGFRLPEKTETKKPEPKKIKLKRQKK